jgi:hypothetical protein
LIRRRTRASASDATGEVDAGRPAAALTGLFSIAQATLVGSRAIDRPRTRNIDCLRRYNTGFDIPDRPFDGG